MAASTRGPLPPGVYWRRRLALLSVALVVFLGVGKVLDRGSDGSSDDQAEQAGAVDPDQSRPRPCPGTTPADQKGGGKKGKRATRAARERAARAANADTHADPHAHPDAGLPDPSGPCTDNDIFLTPSMPPPVGGTDITILINLQTRTAEACTWQLPRTRCA